MHARGRRLAFTHVLLGALIGCSFDHGTPPGSRDDAARDVPIDVAIDAPADAAIDAPPDASLIAGCPAAPSGCTLFGCAMSPDSCYYYCPTARSASTAQTACESIGTSGCLVTLNNAAEDGCIRAAAGAGGLIYFGAVQSSSGSEPAGGWGWLCGTSTYGPNWTGNEPNNSGFGGEDCAALDTLGGWVDVGCDEAFRSVCEVPRP